MTYCTSGCGHQLHEGMCDEYVDCQCVVEDVSIAGQWVLVVRNDAWQFPDVFGPFPTRMEAEGFAEKKLDHDVVDDDDVTVQQVLAPAAYEECGDE